MSKYVKGIILLALLLLAMAGPASAAIVYVNNSLGTNGSGATPATAVNNMQDALTWASVGDTLWVTGGTYAEGVLNLNKNLEIHGGFAAPNFDSRDISGNATVIDGQDVARNSAMIVISGITDVRIDGLTVTGGNNDADLAGGDSTCGGIYINGCSPVITSCTVTGNRSVSAEYCKGGAGIVARNSGSDAMVYNTLISANQAVQGGSAQDRMGGGVSATDNGEVTFINCRILDNTETGRTIGTGVSSSYGGMVRLINCVVAGHAGPNVAMRRNGYFDFINTTLVGGGNGVYIRDTNASTVNLTNCIIANAGIGIIGYSGTTVVTTITNCLFDNNGTDINWTNADPGNPLNDGGGNITQGAPFFSAPNMRTYARFTDPSSHDYSLLEGSLAIDRGTATGAPTFDIDGNPRAVDGNSNSSGAQHDIGAYEYQSTGNWDDTQRATFYVKVGGTGSGSYWDDPMGDPDAEAGDAAVTSATVFVAAGTYTVAGSVQVFAGQNWYGGFPATGEPTMGDRDPWANVTTIYLPGTHYVFDCYDNSSQKYMVVDGFDAVVDSGYRGAVLGGSNNYSPFVPPYVGHDYVTFRNCIFRGGIMGFYVTGGHVTFEDCLFSNNVGAGSSRGGGYSSVSYAGPIGLTMRRCTFVNNVDSAGNTDGYSGGGIFYRMWPNYGDTGVIEDCLFVGNKDENTGTHGGGAIGIRDGSAFEVRNCVFVGNTAVVKGGAIACHASSSNQDFVNNTFYKNTTPGNGGAIYYPAGQIPEVVNSLFLDNSDASGNALFVDHDNVASCLFQGSNDNPPTAQGNVYGDPRFTKTAGTFDAAGSYDAASMTTTFVDSGASYTPNALRNTPIELNTGEFSVVLVNTATAIIVAGDHSAASGAYTLLDFTPGNGSWAVDTGTDAYGGVTVPTTDFNGDARDVDVTTVGGDGAGNAYDIGAVERQSTANAEVLVYVDDDATAGGDGTKAAPYQTIGEGVREYGPGWDASVLVAGGVYPELVDMQEYLKIRGGFSSDFSARNLLDTPTTITGQAVARAESVVTFTSGDNDARIDGVSVTGANVTETNGGGIEIFCRASVTSCVSTANRVEGAYYGGGAALCLSSAAADDVLIANSEFTSNSAICDDGFDQGTQTGRVGGIRLASNVTGIVIKDCYVANNYGGFASGLLVYSGPQVDVQNTIFAGNVGDGTNGGGAIMHRYGTSTFANCTFYDNAHIGDLVGSLYGSGNGDAFYTRDGSRDDATFVNCIFSRNGNTQGGTQEAVYIRSGATIRFANCLVNESDFYGGSAPVDLGGNVSTLGVLGGVAGTFTNPNFQNAAMHQFALMPGSAAIDAGISGTVSGVVVPTTDFSGVARDYDIAGIGGAAPGGAYDIGAFENNTITVTDGAVYVDDDAAPGGDGSKLAPFQSLAIAVPRGNPNWPNGGVYAAGGSYYENIGLGNGSVVRGGYSADFSERDTATYESVIDGQHTTRTVAMVSARGVSGARIDGFTIRRGHNRMATGGGVGVENGASIVVTSCTISDNYSGDTYIYLNGGGGIQVENSGSYVLVENCTITSNTAFSGDNYSGSGFNATDNATADIRNTYFIRNLDPITGNLYGSALGVMYGAEVTATNCVFYDNPGPSIYIRRPSSKLTLVNSTVIGYGGGQGVLTRGDSFGATVVNCIFTDSGYGVYRSESNGTANVILVANSLFDNVSDAAGGATSGIYDLGGNISEDPVLGGTAGTDTDPQLVTLPGQEVPYLLTAGSPAIDAGLTTTSTPGDDIFYLARDGSPDIGAHEYQASGLAPMIVLQPEHVVADPTDTAVFSVAAIGSPLLSYQWEFNDGGGWVNVGVNGAMHTVDPVAESDEGSYRVTITNDVGSVVSSVVTLTVNDPPVITVEPSDVHVALGSPASFSVTVTGSAPLTFQWQKDGGVVSGDATHVITSTDTGSTLNITSVIPTDVGVYRVQVSNSAGIARSVYVALTIDGPVQVLKQPTTQTTAFGSEVEFTVFVSGTQPMTYVWSRNGSPLSDGGNISGSATNALTLNPVGWTDAMGAQYQVNITNALTPAGVDSVIVGIRLLPTGVSPWWEMMK